jgi:hypothetical protein
MGWSAATWSASIERTSDRLRCLDHMRATLDGIGTPTRSTRQLVLAADELLSNAIFNAPRDAAGEAYLREVPRDEDRPLEAASRPGVRWAADGRQLAVEVTDRFGSLTAAQVRGHVGKLLSREGAIRRDTAGAGLGLAMAYDACSSLVFNIERCKSTQAIGLIDLSPRDDSGSAPISSLHVFETNTDA